MSAKLFNKNLVVRTLSGIALLVIVVGSVFTSQWSFALLLTVIGVGCLREFYRIASLAGAQPQVAYGTALGAVLIATTFFVVRGELLPVCLVLFCPLLAVTFIIELYRRRDNPLVNISATLAGLVYVVLPMALFFYIAFVQEGIYSIYTPWRALSYICIVWANDIGAYLFGVSFGRHKLFERISPKKSWEGFIGGVLVAVLVGVFAGKFMGSSQVLWGGLALIIAVSGVLGDLIESMFKRAVDIKDSGAIMPGHGGFLDRFDALIVSIPFAIVYFLIFDL